MRNTPLAKPETWSINAGVWRPVLDLIGVSSVGHHVVNVIASFLPSKKAEIDFEMVRHDGCVSQFTSAAAQSGVQHNASRTMPNKGDIVYDDAALAALTPEQRAHYNRGRCRLARLYSMSEKNGYKGTMITDCRATTRHGKYLYDGFGKGPQEKAKAHAAGLKGEDAILFEPGTRDFCMWQTAHLRAPVNVGSITRGEYGANHYVHACYPDDAHVPQMAPKCLSWKDSNAHHALRGTFGGADITRRLKLCCCDPCLLRNKWSGCLSNRVDRGTWHGDRQGPRVILPVKVPKKMELRGVISLDSIRHWPVFVHPNNVNVLKRVVAVRCSNPSIRATRHHGAVSSRKSAECTLPIGREVRAAWQHV